MSPHAYAAPLAITLPSSSFPSLASTLFPPHNSIQGGNNNEVTALINAASTAFHQSASSLTTSQPINQRIFEKQFNNKTKHKTKQTRPKLK
jgi:hypothetical protein